MKVEVENQPHCVATLKIELPPEQVSKEWDAIASGFAAQARIPGYRPGKAPRRTIHIVGQEERQHQQQENPVEEWHQEALDQISVAMVEVVVFAAHGFHVAPFVCYDLRFPEIFRAAAMRGANLFVVIALWPVKRQQHWLTLLQARAIENQAFVVGVNRVGTEPQFHYAGRSVVIDPH